MEVDSETELEAFKVPKTLKALTLEIGASVSVKGLDSSVV